MRIEARLAAGGGQSSRGERVAQADLRIGRGQGVRFFKIFSGRLEGVGCGVALVVGPGGGVHHDGAGGGGRSVGPRVLVRAGEVERGEEGGDLGGFFDDSDGAELARAERAFKRIDAPDVFD